MEREAGVRQLRRLSELRLPGHLARRGHAGASPGLPRGPHPLASSGASLDAGMAEDGGGACRANVASLRAPGIDRDGTGDDGRRGGDPLPGHDRCVRRGGSRLHRIDAGDAAGGESAAGPAHRSRSRRLRRRTGHDRTAGAVLRLARPAGIFGEGYTNPVHLAPAFAGALLFSAGLLCEIGGTRKMRRLRALHCCQW